MAPRSHEYHMSPKSRRPQSRLLRPRTPSQTVDRPSSSASNSHSSQSLVPTLSPSANASPPPSSNQHRSRQAPPRLPALPRFHPANFVTTAPTPASPSNTVNFDTTWANASGPLSPRTCNQLRQYSEAQRQLFLYHRELVNLNMSHGSASSSGVASPAWRTSRPASPHLKPLGSPGPITPLELELELDVEADQGEGFFVAVGGAGARQKVGTPLSETAKEEILEQYIRKETQPTTSA